MYNEERIRSIVQSELRTNEMWNFFLGNPQMEREVSRKVNSYLDNNLHSKVVCAVDRSVSVATKSIKIDALNNVNDLLNNDSRIKSIVDESVRNIQSMVQSEIGNGMTKIRLEIDKSIGDVVKKDKYNSLNQAFLSNLSSQCDSTLQNANQRISAELDQVKKENYNFKLEVNSKCEQINSMQCDIAKLRNNQSSIVLSASFCGASLGLAGMFLINTLNK